MAAAKTTTITLRVEPAVKQALREAASSEHRSLANMVEVLIRDYCYRHDIAILQPPGPRSSSRTGARHG
jgi:hypothetical protein